MRYLTADRIYTLSKVLKEVYPAGQSEPEERSMAKENAEHYDELPPISEGTLVVEDDGTIMEILPYRVSREDLEIYSGVICPGFINAHTHLELSHLKGLIPEHTGLVDFILHVQKIRGASPEIIQDAIQKAYQEMFEEGIMGFGDISNTNDSFAIKSPINLNPFISPGKEPKLEIFPQEKGFKGDPLNLYDNPYYSKIKNQEFPQKLRSHTFIECFGFNPERAVETLNRGLKLKEEALRMDLSTSITPHAPYSVSKKLFDLIREAEEQLLSVHNQESATEDQFYKTGEGDFKRLYETLGIDISFFKASGKTSLESYFPWLGPQKKLLVHNTFTNSSDAHKFSLENTYWCLCPGANLFIEDKFPGIPRFESFKGKILLGTDSLASNKRLSILSEMRYLQKEFSGYSLYQLLIWACRNGAEFFNWTELGSIEVGKKPGILLLEGLGKEDTLLDKSSVRRII